MCGLSGPWAGWILLHYLQKDDLFSWSYKYFPLPLQHLNYYILPKFPSRKDKNIPGTVWLIPGAFAKVCPPDVFLFPLQNHAGHGNKCSLRSATESVPMQPWLRGDGVLVLCVYSELWLWILQDLEVDPGWRKHDPSTCFCCCHSLKGQENKSNQEPRLALKCWAGLSEGKERMRWLSCLNSCSESEALFPCPSLAAQQPPARQVK